MTMGQRGWLSMMPSHICSITEGNMHTPLPFNYKETDMNIWLSRSSTTKIYLFCNIKGWLSFRKQNLSSKCFITNLWYFIYSQVMHELELLCKFWNQLAFLENKKKNLIPSERLLIFSYFHLSLMIGLSEDWSSLMYHYL